MSRVSGAAARRREPEVFGGRRVAAFGETLVVGLAVTALALPLVTAAPALAAGTRHLTNHVEGRSDTVGSLFRDGWRAIRTGWLFGRFFSKPEDESLWETMPEDGHGGGHGAPGDSAAQMKLPLPPPRMAAE